MRHFLSFAATVFLFAAGWCARERFTAPSDLACRDAPHGGQQPTKNNCADDSALPDDLLGIEDNSILARLTEQGAKLMEQGKTTEAQQLRKQLDQDKCQLEPAAASGPPAGLSGLYDQARESVVVFAGLYKCQRCDRWHAAPATGFVVSASGAVVTNYHVLEGDDKSAFVVMTADGHVHPVVRVLAASHDDDLAIVQVEATGLKPLPIAQQAPIGTTVGVISHPANRFYSFTTGIVSRYTKTRGDSAMVDALQITADYARGSSGAPVLNPQGEVVGIVKSTESIYYSTEDGEGKNLQMVFKTCVPSRSLRKLIGG